MQKEISINQLEVENNTLFQQILDRHYLNDLRKGKGGHHIEIFLQASCPSNCKYCYLKRHKEELYPSNYENKENLKRNMNSLLDYYIDNRFRTVLELFSGECISNGLLFEMLDLIYNKFKDVDLYGRPRAILIADNFDFINSDVLTEKIQFYIDKFKQLEIIISFSGSIDGKFMDENRNKEHVDAFYQKVFDFCVHNNYLIHPMVYANNIDKWIENYNWLKSDEVPSHISWRIGALEVRDDVWDSESLEAYSQYLKHVIKTEFEKNHHSNIWSFTERAFGVDNPQYRNYDTLHLAWNDDIDQHAIGCSAQRNLTIRLGDLAIIRCHRTAYNEFVGGWFITNSEGKIIGVKAGNIPYYVATLAWNLHNAPKCQDCIFRYICMGPCLGANLEFTGTTFMSPDSVCDMHKTRLLTLLMTYEDMGVFEVARQNKKILPKMIDQCEEILNLYKRGIDENGYKYLDDDERH